ncbi:MAG: tRNA-guanosine(34) transglycosylase [Chlamydiae bacterium]|nr:tRNA-guanosine(34) transglycosylase [Chlamydiota bacterium]
MISTSTFHFELIHTSKKSRARVGRIHTPHGIIETPSFVAVGTNGALKAVDNTLIDEMGLDLMFCNTYHLMLQPGTEVIKNAGGIHKFIGRKKPIITDSGGFQVFSLAYGSVASELKSQGKKKIGSSVLKITEEGVRFRSYRDGSEILLTPESSVLAQKNIGADIIIPFDELPPYHIDPKVLYSSLLRTHRWEKRSLDEHLKNPNGQAMYAVVHGGVDDELRKFSANHLSKLSFDGFAIGGSMGKTKPEMVKMLTALMPHIPEDKPNHLLGIADLDSLSACIPLGIDTFDSSYPTKAARHGSLLTSMGTVKVTRGIFQNAHMPVDQSCPCHTCQNYTLAYLHHLFKAHEMTAYTLASIHNLQFMISFMKKMREEILEDRL